jgi:hypothetical protein
MNPGEENIEKFRKFLDGKANNPGENEVTKKLASIMATHLDANKEEINRAQTQLPVVKPTEGGPEACVQLSEILVEGFKTPEFDETGHSVSRAAVYSDTQILDIGLYLLLSTSCCRAASSLYHRYTDEPTIFFREEDRRIILFLPKENESIAIKTDNFRGFTLKPEYRHQHETEYI